MRDAILKGYRDAATSLIDKFESVSSQALYTPISNALPQTPCRVLDIGAGTGRDAAWFAGLGHQVTAVEPIAAFRAAGQYIHRAHDITWIDDTLPSLSRTLAQKTQFDVITLSAVWHHLDPSERTKALGALNALAAPQARLIMSLRKGPAHPARATYPADATDTIAAARATGFSLTDTAYASSAQSDNETAGVTWTWLAFQAS